MKRLSLKAEHRGFSLVKEQRTSVAETRDPAQALKAISDWFHKRYALGKDLGQNETRLGASGYSENVTDPCWKPIRDVTSGKLDNGADDPYEGDMAATVDKAGGGYAPPREWL